MYFDIAVDGNKEEKQRVVFGLFGTIAPKTVDNFRALATCNKGRGAITGKPLCYKGSSFHRVIPHFGLQGGDFTHHDGTGGESIYGGRFEDESFQVSFRLPYMLAMSNTGKKHTNGSQFFITTVKAQWLTGKNVIFGMVLEGREVLDELEESYGTFGGKPSSMIEIVDCGEAPLLPQDKEVHYS